MLAQRTVIKKFKLYMLLKTKFLIPLLLFIVCQELDNEFLSLAENFGIKSGSTLLMSLIENGKFTISNIGDSVGLLMKQSGQMVKLTNEQLPNREDE